MPTLKNTCPSALHICRGAHATLPATTCLYLTCSDNFIPALSCRRTCALLAWVPPPAQVHPHVLAYILAHLPRCLGTPPAREPPVSPPAASPSSSRRTESGAGWASPSLPPQPLRSARAARRPPLYRAGSRPPLAALPGTAAPGLPQGPGGAASRPRAAPRSPWPLPLLRPRAHFLGNAHPPKTPCTVTCPLPLLNTACLPHALAPRLTPIHFPATNLPGLAPPVWALQLSSHPSLPGRLPVTHLHF